MKKNSIFALALQLLGIYAIINSLPLIGGLLSSLAIPVGPEGRKYILLGSLVSFALLILSGVFLISLGSKIAKDPELSDKESFSSNGQINYTILSELSFAIFGLFIIINIFSSLPRFFGNLYGLMNEQSTYKSHLYLTTIASGINIIFQLALGVWLFIGSKGFVKLWQKLRQRWDYERKIDTI